MGAAILVKGGLKDLGLALWYPRQSYSIDSKINIHNGYINKHIIGMI